MSEHSVENGAPAEDDREVEELRARLARVEVLAELMARIDAEYHEGDRATNAVTAVSVAARLRAILHGSPGVDRGVWP